MGLPGNSGAYRQTVQMGLAGKVCDLCQICNWARTMTLPPSFTWRTPVSLRPLVGVVLSLSYQTGDLFWLNTKNIRTCRPCKKLDDKWIGPFKVLKTVGSCACHLELPHTLKIHSVFHVSLLHLTPANPIPGQSNEHPGPVIGQDTDKEFQVEEILDSKPAMS